MRNPPKACPWETDLIESEFDDNTDIGQLITTTRGERRTLPRGSAEHRRSNRYVEDGYGELDFA
ncbi:hypothetical protein [Bradyrhizobium sp. SZCCHNS3053]|uniref:hypothetical protein n=1 Tax=Bradyrhizobium sp. SZCCHNS3053 TaxID=3057322 RepID=UPI002916FB79|nr:hypothetical protein [Bradyrhizobium sp. SZCCHNS3053]